MENHSNETNNAQDTPTPVIPSPLMTDEPVFKIVTPEVLPDPWHDEHDDSVPSPIDVANPVWNSPSAPFAPPFAEADAPEPVTAIAAPRRDTARRGLAVGIILVGGVLLLTGLFKSSGLLSNRTEPPAATRPAISASRRAAWQKNVEGKAFSLARAQARREGQSLNTGDKQNVARLAVLQTINANGGSYSSYNSAKNAGAADATLWHLALTGASNGGILPRRVVRRSEPRRVASSTRRVARRRSTSSSKQVRIMGRGAIGDGSSAIINIPD